jgi:hypothetical protein
MNQRLSTAYHPETDGQTERTNSTLEQYLRSYTNFQQDDWAELIAVAEFAYNNAWHSAIKMLPFMASKGEDFKFSLRQVPGSIKLATAFRERMEEVREQVMKSLELARTNMGKYADRKRRNVPTEGYEVGDLVMLSSEHVTTVRPSRKLDWKTFGPFQITEKVGNSGLARRLELPSSMRRVHNVFHVSLLIPYKANTRESRRVDPPPPPEVADNGEAAYEVAEILDSRVRKGRVARVEYFVSWKGYDMAHNDWVGAGEFDWDDDVVISFHRQYPSKPTPRRSEYRKGNPETTD